MRFSIPTRLMVSWVIQCLLGGGGEVLKDPHNPCYLIVCFIKDKPIVSLRQRGSVLLLSSCETWICPAWLSFRSILPHVETLV